MNYVSGGVSPPQSLALDLKVTVGRNQIQRNVGSYTALYFADGFNTQDAYVELSSLGVWNSNPQETYKQLVLSCSGPVQFRGVRPDNTTIVLTVNSLLVLDSEFRAFTLSNIGTNEVRAQLNYVSTRP